MDEELFELFHKLRLLRLLLTSNPTTPADISRVKLWNQLSLACGVFNEIVEDESVLKHIYTSVIEVNAGEELESKMLLAAILEWQGFIAFERRQFEAVGMYPFEVQELIGNLNSLSNLTDIQPGRQFTAFPDFMEKIRTIRNSICNNADSIRKNFSLVEHMQIRKRVVLRINGLLITAVNATSDAIGGSGVFSYVSGTCGMTLASLPDVIDDIYKKDG